MPYGQDAVMGIAFQTSHGTPVTATTSFYPIPFLSENITPQYPELLVSNMEGRFDEGVAHSGPRQVAGTITNEALPVPLGIALKAICGSAAITASNNIFTHVFVPMTADFDSNVSATPITMYKNVADGGTQPIYKDLVATRLELSVSNGEFLTAALNLTGGVVATKIASVNIGIADIGKEWTWDVTSIELGGSANTDFADLTIIQDEQATSRWTLKTSRDPDRVKRDAKRQIRVNGTVQFVDQTEYDLFLAGTLQALKITMRASAATAIESGYYDTLEISVPSFKYLTYPVEFSDPSELLIGFEGKAEYHAGSGHSIQYTVINTQDDF